MKCPSDTLSILRCNQILDAAELLIESQGIVSFKFSQLAKEVGCSTGTLYKFFERKEDVLVCLFLRSATSNHLPIFINKNPELTAKERVLLPILFTFETIKRSKSFATLRSVSVNTMVWQLASDEKVERFKKRINAFWGWFTDSLNLAVEKGELEATPLQVKELVQGITFYLTGALTQFESQLIAPEYLSNRRETCYRHLAKLMGQYKWKMPLTPELYDSLEARTIKFFDQHYRDHMSCAACSALSCTNGVGGNGD
ncbi:TetR/AcrR family transcriptional regulator [Shewanella sp. SP2S2-4]|jgi:AcrR family transcriptional regulator|uniref:TetR/AcrR family transcriptional regulator n=3 Tax=Shewanellaceae TaxID=267890 RepID=A0AA50KH35_9GAMM|nr:MULTISPECIES: TetR/AcrR family transcriptional regulator [Shewanella]AVI68216.1 TetR family transcriptional regulator [Shewanella sp. WE21]MBW3525316.1 TetR/AcrR family transcriptional regulator [Shewanella sp. NKUCC05_KAH]MDT3275592.1 TetR/AcrR family transcriptional regulator [Shewanella sp. SP2S2-4]MDT3281225.1 TetR/AcrR family transcriptional regulator [Shewanella sp. SP2S1-2]NLQ23541.1 TetR/AcrR family transcriptional regulator [Shewanella oncorhynchi]